MKSQTSEAFYRSLFENALDGFAYCQMLFDKSGNPIDFRYIKVNENFEKLTGLKEAEGRKATELIPGIKTSNPELFEIYGRVALTGKPERFETYIEPLGRWFFVSVYSPKKKFFMAVFQNITGRKGAERNLENEKIATRNVLEDLSVEESKYEALTKDLEKFKLALENVSDNMIITDPEGIVIYANKAVEKVTGYKPEEAVGRKSGALWKTPMPVEYYQKLWDTVKKQKRVFTGEIQNRRKNGEVYTAAISITPILDDKNEVEFFVSIERDITIEKEVDLAKSEFVSLASHQLRTPVSGIKATLAMLVGGDLGPLNALQQQFAERAYQANEREIKLIEDLLSVTRVESGRMTLEPQLADLGQLVQDILADHATFFKQHGQKLLVRLPRRPVRSWVDPDKLRLVIDNLVDNARKYTPDGGTITVAVRRLGTSILLSVADTGIGIPRQDQSKLFQKFSRVASNPPGSPDGTGLGLYLVKRIVEMHHGRVTVRSARGRGSTFTVRLPYHERQP